MASTSSAIQQIIFRKPSRKYSTSGFERRSIWGKTGIDLNGSESGSAGDTTSERGSSSPGMRSRSISISRPPSAYSAYSARTARSAASAPLATAQNTEKELPKPYEANEGSEISTIIEDNEDTETINGERANESESVSRNGYTHTPTDT